jgi:serine/threonine protein kinase
MWLEQQLLGDYSISERINVSGPMKLYLARHKITLEAVAIKQFSKQEPDEMLAFECEVSSLRRVFHPFIIGFYELMETDSSFYVVAEWPQTHSLLDLINRIGFIDEPAAKVIFLQILCAFEYLHYEKEILFLNLKAENIRFDWHDNIRIGDFSLSKGASSRSDPSNSIADSTAYSAPEIVIGQPITHTTDIWSLGILLFALTAGRLPFQDSNRGRLVQKIATEDPLFPLSITPMLNDLLHRMLSKDPRLRITLEGIKQHPWFRSRSEIPRETFDFDAVNRLRILRDPMLAPTLDPEIVAELESSGVAIGGLKDAFMNQQQTVATVSYSIRVKQKMADELAELIGDNIARPPPLPPAEEWKSGKPMHRPPSGIRSWRRPRDAVSLNGAAQFLSGTKLAARYRVKAQSPEPRD